MRGGGRRFKAASCDAGGGELRDITQVPHQVRRLTEEEKWFDKYFFNKS